MTEVYTFQMFKHDWSWFKPANAISLSSACNYYEHLTWVPSEQKDSLHSPWLSCNSLQSKIWTTPLEAFSLVWYCDSFLYLLRCSIHPQSYILLMFTMSERTKFSKRNRHIKDLSWSKWMPSFYMGFWFFFIFYFVFYTWFYSSYSMFYYILSFMVD